MCDTICKYKLTITELVLSDGTMSKDNLDSLGCLVVTLKSLESLHLLCSYVEGLSLNSSDTFYDALCNTKSVKKLEFKVQSNDDSKMISTIFHHNESIEILRIHGMTNADHLAILFDGLSSNKTVAVLIVHPSCVSDSITLGPSIEKCLVTNQSLTFINFWGEPFTDIRNMEATWSSPQVCSICTSLKSNNTLVTLDISGCQIDNTASDAVCVMLSLNTSLQHLFLNPVHLEKPEAVAIIDTCNTNTTLEVLSLVKWPKEKQGNESIDDLEFTFSSNQEINRIISQVKKSRQDKKKLDVLWLV